SPRRSAIASPTLASPWRQRQRRPYTDCSTPNATPAKASAPPAPSSISDPDQKSPCSYRHPRAGGDPEPAAWPLLRLDLCACGKDEVERFNENQFKVIGQRERSSVCG